MEGWVGAKLVDTVLDPVTITIHLLLALIIIGLIIFSAIQAYYAIAGNFESKSSYHPNTKPVILGILMHIYRDNNRYRNTGWFRYEQKREPFN